MLIDFSALYLRRLMFKSGWITFVTLRGPQGLHLSAKSEKDKWDLLQQQRRVFFNNEFKALLWRWLIWDEMCPEMLH